MSTRFVVPADREWDERPRGAASRLARRGGFVLLVVWLLALAGFAAWQVAAAPEDLAVKLFVFGGGAAAVLLLVSVLVDRLRALPADRYRKVEK
jgi:hypothetical protein